MCASSRRLLSHTPFPLSHRSQLGNKFAKHFGPTNGTGTVSAVEFGNEPWGGYNATWYAEVGRSVLLHSIALAMELAAPALFARDHIGSSHPGSCASMGAELLGLTKEGITRGITLSLLPQALRGWVDGAKAGDPALPLLPCALQVGAIPCHSGLLPALAEHAKLKASVTCCLPTHTLAQWVHGSVCRPTTPTERTPTAATLSVRRQPTASVWELPCTELVPLFALPTACCSGPTEELVEQTNAVNLTPKKFEAKPRT